MQWLGFQNRDPHLAFTYRVTALKERQLNKGLGAYRHLVPGCTTGITPPGEAQSGGSPK